jgi:hypothetical protein
MNKTLVFGFVLVFAGFFAPHWTIALLCGIVGGFVIAESFEESEE